MPGYPKIIGERIYLRTLEPTDLDRCLRWINDPDVTRFIISDFALYNSVREEEWLRNLYKSDTDLLFAICLKDGDRHIGNTSLHAINRFYHFGSFGILIGEKEFWGKGYGTETAKLMIDYAFSAQNLNRLELGAFAFNKRAIACYEKAGFVHEGALRKKFYKEGAYHDEIIMSVLREDWDRR